MTEKEYKESEIYKQTEMEFIEYVREFINFHLEKNKLKEFNVITLKIDENNDPKSFSLSLVFEKDENDKA